MTKADIMLFNAGTVEEIKDALDMGANVNARDEASGVTILMRIVRFDPTAEKTRLLIEAGANVRAISKYGYTALMYSMWSTTAEVTRLLIEAGADVNVSNDEGKTALMYASWSTVEQMRLLIEAGADVNARDSKGNTALMYAKTPEQIRVLIDAGVDVNARNNFGYTALMLAEERSDFYKRVLRAIERSAKLNGAEPPEPSLVLAADNNEQKKLTLQLENMSGVVFADAIAKMKRDGKIQGDVTPERGKELRAQIMRERAMWKK